MLAIAAAVSTVVLARVLPVERFGKVSVLLLAYNLTSVFDAVRPVTLYFANRHADRPEATFASIFWLNAGIGAALGAALGGAALLGPVQLFGSAELLCLAAAFTLFFLQSTYWGWADAHGLVARTALARAVIMTLVYGAFVALAIAGADGLSYALVLLGATAFTLALFWRMCRSQPWGARIGRPDRALLHLIGVEVRRYMQFSLATLVLATMDRIAASAHGGSRALGLYSGHFDLATKPMALVRALQTALNPHVTRAAVGKSDVFPALGLGTKALFVALSLGAWTAVLLRDPLTELLLGQSYVEQQDVFALVALAQCFVLLGYASALLLNAIGDFRLQRNFYSIAALAMLVISFPAVQLAGILGVAAAYLLVRTVDVWLLLGALRRVGRSAIATRVVLAAIVWCAASAAAWSRVPWVCAVCAALFAVLLWRWQLTRPASR